MRLILSVAMVALAGLATGSGYGSGYGYGTHAGRGRGGGIRSGSGGVRGGAGGQGGHGYGQNRHRFFLSFTDPYLRHGEFTWDEASYQCQKRGLVLVSLDDQKKDYYVAQLLARYYVQFIWTSGTKRGYNFVWGNGKPVGHYYSNWSRTGGNGYPQPDNREGNEYCLAVLNNFYKDGIVWHDIGCHHKKAFICEHPYYQH